MKPLKELLSHREYLRFQELMALLETGRWKSWTPDDFEGEFDEEKALQNFQLVMESGLVQEHVEKMKQIFGNSSQIREVPKNIENSDKN